MSETIQFSEFIANLAERAAKAETSLKYTEAMLYDAREAKAEAEEKLAKALEELEDKKISLSWNRDEVRKLNEKLKKYEGKKDDAEGS